MNTTPRDSELFDLFCSAIKTGLEYVDLAKKGKRYIGTHNNWPELQRHDNGLPWITHKTYDTPKNYADVVSGFHTILLAIGGEKPPEFIKEPSFLALAKYAQSNSRLREFFTIEKLEELEHFPMALIVGYALDHYVHVNKTTTFDRDKLLPVYLPLENYLLDAELPIMMMVPILFLKFEFQTFHITESISLERISDELQLARGWKGSWGFPNDLIVESAATHALFIRDQRQENNSWLQRGNMQMSLESYPIEDIDTFFAALRIVTGKPTGYAQILTVPIGWASLYVADIVTGHFLGGGRNLATVAVNVPIVVLADNPPST